uniref:Uncharacterized protein n=1 Tax=Triticum urartu TaxID=4572 RepID=A0A8R7UCC0_TRIUA
MAPEVAMVLGLLMLRPNRPCRRRRRSRPGFLPDWPLQTCTRTRYWSPRTTQWTSTLSQNLQLLHHHVCARCMVGGHGWSCNHPRHKITRSRRRPNLRRLCRPRSPSSRTPRVFHLRRRRTRRPALGLLRRALASGCASPRGLLHSGTSSTTGQAAPLAHRRPAAGT